MKRSNRILATVVAVVTALVAVRLIAGRRAGASQIEEARARFVQMYGPLPLELVDQRPSPEENAAPLLIEAGKRLRLAANDLELIGTCEESPAAISEPAVRLRLSAVAAENAESLALVDRAAERSDALFSARRDLLRDGSFETAIDLTRMSRLVRALGTLAVEEDDDAALTLQIERLSTIARALRQQRAIGFLTVALRAEESLFALLHQRVRHEASPERIERWRELVDILEAAPAIREILATEAAVAYDRTGDPTNGGASDAEPWYSIWTNDHWRADLLTAYLEAGNHFDTSAALLGPGAAPPDESSFRRIAVLFDPSAKSEVLRWMLLPGLLAAVDQSQQVDALRTLATETLRRAAGETPSEPAPAPWTGERLHVRAIGDGRVELALPEAATALRALAAEFEPEHPRHRWLANSADRMTWVLAVPSRPTS